MNPKIDELVHKISEASVAYYNTGEPLMSDEEFDSLVIELKTIDPSNPILDQPGWGGGIVDSHLERKNHSFFVGGLDKIKSGYLSDLVTSSDAVFMSKLDGISAVVYYVDGYLDCILTRGDGETGLDITKNLSHLIGSAIPTKVEGVDWIRGEVVVSQNNVLGGYKNARNMAAGLCNQVSQGEFHQYLEFIAYQCEFHSTDRSREYQLRFLSEIMPTVRYTLDKDKADSLLNYSVNNIEYPYLVDGAVIQDGSSTYAVKFNNVGHVAEVVKVHYEVSGRGRVNPIIEIKPLEIDGTTVTYCSGFNYTHIKNDGIGPGALIEITKANEVIPHWVKTLRSVEPSIPTEIDGRETYWEGSYLWVTNSVEDYLNNSRDNILAWHCPHGFGWAKCQSMIDNVPLTGLGHLFHFAMSINVDSELMDNILSNALSPTFIDRGKELILSIRNGIKMSWLLQSPMITGLGEVASVTIAKYYNSSTIKFCEDLKSGSFPDELHKQMPTYVALDACLANKEVLLSIFDFNWPILPEDLGEEEVSADLIGVCLTGTLSKPRSQLIEEWKSVAIEVNISQARVLITDNPNSNSSKAKKARSMGIEILSEIQFRSKYVK